MNGRQTWIAALMLVAGTTSAQAQGVGVTLKLLDFDVTQPAREGYRDVPAGNGLISFAVERAWGDLSGTALDPVKQWLGASNRLGSGMTARDIGIQLGSPGAMQLASTGQSKGRLTMAIAGNAIELTSTHPVSRGKWMDPRLRVGFDMTLTIDFSMVEQPPYVRASEAVLQPGNVRVSPLNLSAELGLSIDEIVSSLGGTQTISARVRDAFAGARVPVTNAFNAQLRSQGGLLALPNGYRYNGGRVEPGRIVVAGYKVKQAAGTNVAIVATWPKSLGTLMDDCRPVGIGATWQSGPKPYSGVNEPPSTAAQMQNVNPRTERGSDYGCSAVLRVPQGAPISVTWSDPVRVNVGSPNPMVMKTVVAARPAGWANPVVAKGSEVALVLSRESRAGTGVQFDRAARPRGNPLDPVAGSTVTERINPAERITPPAQAHPALGPVVNPAAIATQPASRALTPSRAAAPATAAVTAAQPGAAVSLNPQPLPPKAAASAAATRAQPGAAVSLNPQPLPPKAAPSAAATRAQPGAAVLLNPQPLPPKEAASRAALQAPASSLSR